MLSIITTDASTIMPTPRIRPVSVIMLSVIPAKFMHSSVMRMESGMEMPMMMVLLNEQRNTYRMMIASSSPCHADSKSVLIVSRMLSVESLTISIDTSSGS